MNRLNELGRFLSDLLQDDDYNNVEPYLIAVEKYINELVKEKNNLHIDLGVTRQSLYETTKQHNKVLVSLKETETIIEIVKRLRLIPVSTEFNNQIIFEQEKKTRKELWYAVHKYEKRKTYENNPREDCKNT